MTNTDSAESRIGDSNSVSPSPMIVQAVKDAQIILNYIAASDLKIDAGIVDVIVTSKHLLSHGKWSNRAEIDFWEGFSQLNRAIQPASIDSLKAILPKSQTMPTKRKSLRLPSGVYFTEIVFRSVALAVLIVVLLLQGYWLFGAGVVKQIKSLQNEEVKLRISEKSANAKTSGPGGIQNKETGGGDQAYTAAVEKNLRKDIDDENQAENRRNEIEKRILASFNSLIIWMFWLPEDTFKGKNVVLNEQLTQERINRIAREITRDRRMYGSLNGEASTELDKKIEENRRRQQSQQRDLDREKKEYARILMIIPAEFILQVLISYILPLAYGILGAATYVLRSLSIEIRIMTFKGESFIKYWLRLALGALGGLSIGWFLTPESTFGIASIPPLAVSFLVGYNIELLFSVMDRFIAAMTAKKETGIVEMG